MNDVAVEDLVRQVREGMAGLARLMADPAVVSFEDVHPYFAQLEEAVNSKTTIDAAFAWLADLYRAGNKVGSSSTAHYLSSQLGITHAEAQGRLRRGRKLFDPVAEPPPPPSGGDDAAGADDDGSAATAAAQDSAHDRAKKRAAKEDEARATSRGAKLSEHKRRIIEHALEFLSDDADPGYFTLFNQAAEMAREMSSRALHDWVKEAVLDANKKGRDNTAEDYNAAFSRRRIWVGKQDAHGGVQVRMYLPADMAAVFVQAINPNRTSLLDGTDLAGTEEMTHNQRQIQLLVAMCRNFLNTTGPNLKGVGSIVVSMTEQEAANITLSDRFPTNTGFDIDALGLIRLGVAGKDFVVTHDAKGRAIHVDTGKRTANLYQRIALFAEQLVCIEPGCSRPMMDCDAHHIVAHSMDGPSAGFNFAWMCFAHHRDNNDTRNPASPFGWADRCTNTGRVGKRARAGEDITFNDTPAAEKSGGAKIRRRHAQNPAPAAASSRTAPPGTGHSGTTTASEQPGLFTP